MKSSRELKWEKMKVELDKATEGLDSTHPVIVSARFYGEMRFHCRGGDYGRFEIIIRAAMLKKGLMAVWNGRPIFVKRDGDPEPYLAGLEVVKKGYSTWVLK